MEQVLLRLLLIALAGALSSVLISTTVFVLLSENRRRSGLAFMAGTVLGTVVTLTIAIVAGGALPGSRRRQDALSDQLEVAIGTAIIVLGVIALLRRPAAGNDRRPRWLDGVGSFGAMPLFGLGLALNIRPKAILLVGAAGLTISGAGPFVPDNLILIGFYTLIATSTVVAPIVATLLAPDRMEPRLQASKGWIAGHSTAVSGVITILVGVFVLGLGLTG
jgi:Sap, sulfolipid-1-addressing protein